MPDHMQKNNSIFQFLIEMRQIHSSLQLWASPGKPRHARPHPVEINFIASINVQSHSKIQLQNFAF